MIAILGLRSVRWTTLPRQPSVPQRPTGSPGPRLLIAAQRRGLVRPLPAQARGVRAIGSFENDVTGIPEW